MLFRDAESGYYYIDASAENPNICVICIRLDVEVLLSEEGFQRLLIRAQNCHICQAIYQAAFSNLKGHIFWGFMRQMVSIRLDLERSQLYFRHISWDGNIDNKRNYIGIQVFTESGRTPIQLTF
jgi:hypothetical protein